MKKFIILMIILLPSVFSANLYGSVYDLNLYKVENAVIEINSSPMQRIVAQNGDYEVNLPPGAYKLKINYFLDNLNYTAVEYVNVIDDGRYVLDLFLYPEIEDEIIDDFDIPEVTINIEPKQIFTIAVVFIAVLVFIFAFFFASAGHKIPKIEKKKKMLEVDETLADDLQEIIAILEKNGKRMNQKEIRKLMGVSEAKLSLMVSDLESQGVVKKVKKGRGNIIILR